MQKSLDSDQNYRKRLINELVDRQRRNPGYSLRGFARDLGVSPTALSQVLNDKRSFSKSNLLKVADTLAFSPSERKRALSEAKEDKSSDRHFTLLEDDVFRFMSDWYYFAILSLAEAGHAKVDYDWLAKRFSITQIQAKDAVERLVRLDLIRVVGKKIVYDGKPLRTTSDVPSSAARTLQSQHLKLAEASLVRDQIDTRDMTSMTMAIKINRIPKAKEMIKSFRRKLSRYLEAENGDEVYVVAIQLFPVTKEVL